MFSLTNSHCECLLSFRALLESEKSQEAPQASVEEQVSTVLQSLQVLDSKLRAQLESIQKQVPKS